MLHDVQPSPGIRLRHPKEKIFSNNLSLKDCDNSGLLEQIPLSDPWLSRYQTSIILEHTAGSDQISTVDKEVYGNNDHPISFRIGNGGAGYTHILEVLCLDFIRRHENNFRIGWVGNHSRHTQAALLGDIVQVALTYEPDMEILAEQEGWCRRVCAPAFWDHFVFVGPKENPAALRPGCSVNEALQKIAQIEAPFHTRGDGSATFTREQHLWEAAGIKTESASWLETHQLAPYQALQKAAEDGAYLLTDRSTFLTAKQDGTIPSLTVYVEGGKALLNPCSALINTKLPNTPDQSMAIAFAEWLVAERAQSIIKAYGRDWKHHMPLFTPAEQEEFRDVERLASHEM